MERRSNKRASESKNRKSAVNRGGRPKASVTAEYRACESDVCQFLWDSNTLHRKVLFAECCSSFFTKRAESTLAHPKSSTTKLEAFMRANGVNSHAEFHKFITREGLEVGLNLKHQTALFSMPQFEAPIDSPVWPEHHQLEKATQTEQTTEMVPKHMLVEERCRAAELERELELVHQILNEWTRTGSLEKKFNATEMRKRLEARR
jgi:hypothetical protein